ncbi:carboxylating nicotinate-nucleotide diphosphorylase [Chloroflexota bacterium]
MPTPAQLQQIIDNALAEDFASDDVTTQALIPPRLKGMGYLVVNREGVLAGIEVAGRVFRSVGPGLKFTALFDDGSSVCPGDKVASVEGSVAGILRAERVALNFLQHLSGIASETARYVAAVSGTRALITDTRKTVPGLRLLEKYAVRAGGGHNHRLNLSDGVLIKDNHLMVLRSRGEGLEKVVRKARRKVSQNLKIEIEVESRDQAREALAAGADIILLDNMKPADMREVVEMVQGRALLEASGGITLDNVRAVAETGVDLISIGALTHSARALDISLDFCD